MGTSHERPEETREHVASAEAQFRDALLRSRRTGDSIGEVESAAARFCRELLRQGRAPEQMVADAKRVIDETLDGTARGVAERAVNSCIQHYFRP